MTVARLLTAIALCTALVPFGTSAASLDGQTFEDNLRLGSDDLKLNGLGIRAVLFFKGYVAGLYLKDKATTMQQVIATAGAKRLQMRMLLNAGPSDFNQALVAGIRVNATEAELAQLKSRITQLEQTISEIGRTVVGDVINIDYLPGRGTSLSVNGTPKGSPIEGADFYHALLGIFVGNHPVDPRLKQGLLGQ